MNIGQLLSLYICVLFQAQSYLSVSKRQGISLPNVKKAQTSKQVDAERK
jgi:hypothetical protein